MGYYAFSYSVKVWLTAVFIAPVIFIGYEWINNIPSHNYTEEYEMAAFFGGVLSFPSFVMLWLFVYLLSYNLWRLPLKKMLLTALGIVFTIFPFGVLFHKIMTSNILTIEISYLAIICAGIWFYRIVPKEKLITVNN